MEELSNDALMDRIHRIAELKYPSPDCAQSKAMQLRAWSNHRNGANERRITGKTYMGKGKNRATSHPIPVQPANKLDQGNLDPAIVRAPKCDQRGQQR